MRPPSAPSSRSGLKPRTTACGCGPASIIGHRCRPDAVPGRRTTASASSGPAPCTWPVIAPLVVAADVTGRDVLDDLHRGGPRRRDPVAEAVEPAGSSVLYAPLMFSEYQGWDTVVQVQNTSGHINAKVKVYFLDRSGDIITTLVAWICPFGSQTYFLPVFTTCRATGSAVCASKASSGFPQAIQRGSCPALPAWRCC